MGKGGRPPLDGTWKPEAVARGLVVSLMPEIERRMSAGAPYLTTMREVHDAERERLEREHGPEATHRARMILEGLGAVAVLTPVGRRDFLLADLIVTPPAPRFPLSGAWGAIWERLAPR